MFARLCPEKMFQVDLFRNPKQQTVPGWNAFNALVCVNKVDESSIGYCLLIKASPTEYSIQLFHACLVNSQNYATRCRGQLNVLLPEAARPRAIVH